MKQYAPANIRNVAVVGHGGCGKTSLCEALLFKAGATVRLGSVADGSSVSDYDPEEVKRKASLSLSVLPLEYKGCKVNLLDTPGLFDFVAGQAEGIHAADSVLIVLSGKSGVTVGAKKAYRLAKKAGKPVLFFISKLDSEHADFYKVLEQLKSEFGPSVCPLSAPAYEGNAVSCFVDLLRKKAYTYQNGERAEAAMPNLEHRLEGLDAAISEAVAESDESLFEKYFSGELFTQQEIINGIHEGIRQGSVQPVLCGSAATLAGTIILLDNITALLPGADTPLQQTRNGQLCAQVFKTVVDPFYGKLSYFRVFAGSLSNGSTPVNSRTGEPEKIGKLILLKGKEQTDTNQIGEGDIGAAVKLTLQTGDQLYEGTPAELPQLEMPKPCYTRAVVTSGDESKVSSAISKLLQEDLTLGFTVNSETRQQLLSGLGEQHLDVAVCRLKSKFGAEVTLEEVRIPYRETIRKKVKVQGRHKKQTGGHGQFGDVWIEFEPAFGDDLQFEEKVFGGAVPKNYFPAVEKGLRESAQHGLLAGYPMVGLKAVLVDGSYHPVDSSEMAFKTAAAIAYRNGIAQAAPVLLEPIDTLSVTVPDNNTGDMMGELNKRRGRVLGMAPSEQLEGATVIEAEVPEAEMLDFATTVRQMTQGAGSFALQFARYEQLPEALHSEVIAKALAGKE